MVKSLLSLIRLARSAPLFELVGSGLIVAGVVMLAGVAWALVTGGVLALLKSLDVALEAPAKE